MGHWNAQTVWVSGLALAATLIGAFLVVESPALAFAALSPILIGFIAMRPRSALYAGIPMIMLPLSLDVAGISAQFLLLAILEVGVVLGSLMQIKRFPLLTALVALASGLLIASYAFHPRLIVSESAALSQVSALILCLGAVITVAIAGLDPKRTIQIIALSGTGISISNVAFAGLSATGRLSTENLNANAIGHIGAISIAALVGLAAAERKPLWLLLSLPSAFAMVGGQSRASFVILGVGLGVLLLSYLTGRTKFLLALGLVVALASSLAFVRDIDDSIFTAGRDGDLAARSTQQRAILLDLTFRLIGQHPLAGVGYRSFPDYSVELLSVGFNTHNDYLRIAVEAGLPSLLVLASIAGFAVVRSRNTRMPLRRVSLSILAAGATSFLFANTMSLLPLSLPFWIVLGLLWAARRNPASPANESSSPAKATLDSK